MAYVSLWQQLISRFRPTAPVSPGCFWTVDIHSHLIPGLDDGVPNEEQALACLKQLAEWGIRKVITTPHVSGDHYPTSVSAIQQGKQTLQRLVDTHQLPLTIDVAAEYMIHEMVFELLQQNALLTFGARQYLLIETGWAYAPHQLEDTLFRIQTHGYTPVLAHPERYRYYHRNTGKLLRLREAGCLFQLNWMSLVGRYGAETRKVARLLLHKQLIDFVGSDVHRPQDLASMARLFNATDLQRLRHQPLQNDSLLNTTEQAWQPESAYRL